MDRPACQLMPRTANWHAERSVGMRTASVSVELHAQRAKALKRNAAAPRVQGHPAAGGVGGGMGVYGSEADGVSSPESL